MLGYVHGGHERRTRNSHWELFQEQLDCFPQIGQRLFDRLTFRGGPGLGIQSDESAFVSGSQNCEHLHGGSP